MKKLIIGTVGGLIYIAIYYLIAYIYLFVLAAPGDGFFFTFLSITILGEIVEIIVATASTGISGMVALTAMDIIGERSRKEYRIAGIIICIAAIIGVCILLSMKLGFWYIIIFGVAMFCGGVKISTVE